MLNGPMPNHVSSTANIWTTPTHEMELDSFRPARLMPPKQPITALTHPVVADEGDPK
jgi:hypothetical protein